MMQSRYLRPFLIYKVKHLLECNVNIFFFKFCTTEEGNRGIFEKNVQIIVFSNASNGAYTPSKSTRFDLTKTYRKISRNHTPHHVLFVLFYMTCSQDSRVVYDEITKPQDRNRRWTLSSKRKSCQKHASRLHRTLYVFSLTRRTMRTTLRLNRLVLQSKIPVRSRSTTIYGLSNTTGASKAPNKTAERKNYLVRKSHDKVHARRDYMLYAYYNNIYKYIYKYIHPMSFI